MENQERFLALLLDSLKQIQEPRFFESERGFQGELLAQLHIRLGEAQLPGEPIVEQEYQKRMALHGLNTRPDIIVHVPFHGGREQRRNQGNFVAMELKLRATKSNALEDFGKLERICEILAYPLVVFINIDSRETYGDYLPRAIANRAVCYAVCLEAGNPLIRITSAVGTR